MNCETRLPNLTPLAALRSIVALLLSASVLLSGCTTLRSVPLPASTSPGQSVTAKVGDEVRAQLRNGEALAFKVTAIEADALVGQRVPNGGEVRVRFQDLTDLRVKRVDPLRTGVAVIGGVAAVAFVAFLVAAATGHIAVMPAGP